MHALWVLLLPTTSTHHTHTQHTSHFFTVSHSLPSHSLSHSNHFEPSLLLGESAFDMERDDLDAKYVPVTPAAAQVNVYLGFC